MNKMSTESSGEKPVPEDSETGSAGTGSSGGVTEQADSPEHLLLHAGRPIESACPRSCPPSAVITVIILCFVNLINYMDRFTLAGVLSSVQDHFHIGDDYGGLLQTSFVISYMLFAPLFGYLGDRYSRKIIMALGIFLWSMTTLIGSYMDDFGWFVVFRALVGIGEASYSTIAPTIISDLFVKNVRSKVLAIFYFAIPVGSGLGYIVGTETASYFGEWQYALRVTPWLGLAAGILIIFCIKDPERGEAEGGSHISTSSYKEDLKSLVKNKSFMLSTLGFTCVTFVAGALAWWGPRYIFLGLKLQPGIGSTVTLNSVSFKFGVITMVSGLIGVPLGEILGEKFSYKNVKAHPLICGTGLFLSAPLLMLTIWTLNSYSELPFYILFFGQLFLNLNWAIVADMLLYVVIPTRRSTAEAFQILISHTFGDAGSPYLIGVVSEALRRLFTQAKSIDENNNNSTSAMLSDLEDRDHFLSLQYALYITGFVQVLGAVFFLVSSYYIVKDKARVEKHITENPNAQRLTPDVLIT